MEKLRKKKVYAKIRSRTYDDIAIPEIRLEGRWLEKLGLNKDNKLLSSRK